MRWKRTPDGRRSGGGTSPWVSFCQSLLWFQLSQSSCSCGNGWEYRSSLACPDEPMKILFLHGWTSTPGGRKPTYLKENGHEVLSPPLPDDDFAGVHTAQAEFDRHKTRRCGRTIEGSGQPTCVMAP